ncbi:MAG: GatB/YqeY domain-containing protein [Planctomycetota bacterium]
MSNETLKARISNDVKDAMRAKDKDRLGVLRMLTAAIKQIEVDQRIDLDEPGVLAVLDKMLKQRKESIEQYATAGRQDLVDKEAMEVEILTAYLPQALTAAEIDALIAAAIAASGATSAREMGKVMALLKPQVQGRADVGAVSAIVKQRLPQG